MNTHVKPPKFAWTDETEEALRRLAGAGHSSTFIADAVGATRNAVCGKAMRLGIQLHGGRVYAPRAAPRPATVPRRNFVYSPRVVDRLRELAAENLLSHQIADVLTREFMGMTTPGSVRSQASKLGIKLIGREAQARVWRQKGASVQKRMKVERHATIWERPAVVASLGVFLIDLTQSSCRYPLGDPADSNFSFCGSPKAPASSYCAGHHQLCYSRGK